MNTQIKLVLLALASLFLGLYLYYFERNGFLIFDNLKSSKILNIFGNLGYNLPSFLHAFSFSLLSVVILGAKRKWIVFSCVFWFFIELIFELGQNVTVSKHLLNLGLSKTGILGRYFYFGTFDTYDLLASFLGVVLTLLLFIKELKSS